MGGIRFDLVTPAVHGAAAATTTATTVSMIRLLGVKTSKYKTILFTVNGKRCAQLTLLKHSGEDPWGNQRYAR